MGQGGMVQDRTNGVRETSLGAGRASAQLSAGLNIPLLAIARATSSSEEKQAPSRASSSPADLTPLLFIYP